MAALTSRELWRVIGAEHGACFTVDSAGTALADGGFNATLRDYARFAKLVLDGGQVGGKTVLSEDWVRSLSSGESKKFKTPYNLVSPKSAYRRQWWVHDVHYGDFMARGIFGQMTYIDPKAELFMVKLSTWPDYLIPAFTIDSLKAIAAIRREFTF